MKGELMLRGNNSGGKKIDHRLDHAWIDCDV